MIKKTLIENGGISKSLLAVLAVIAGISVANLYYNQPLLSVMRQELHCSEMETSHIALLTQVGYALGLLFIIPLGDLYSRKKIVITNFILLVCSLLSIACARTVSVVLGASLVTGICSVIPQIFIPFVAQFSKPQDKGKNVGVVVSGLLTGILASRVLSGFVGDLWGWRVMYFLAAGMMVVSAAVILLLLPPSAPNFKGRYAQLMRSMWQLVRDYPALRVYALRSALAFGSFMGLWATLAFKMAQAPFYAGSDKVGALGLCGVAGALSASVVGRFVERVGVRRFNYWGTALQMFSWMVFYWGGSSYFFLVIGILLLDIGMQFVQLSNQTMMFQLCPSASNRINTIFMTTYFVGGSLGTFLTGLGWSLWGWLGVSAVGFLLAMLSLLVTRCSRY